MTLQDRFRSHSPKSIYLDFQHQKELISLIRSHGWIPNSDSILAIEKPGEGNMNFVVRVKTSSRSLIIKQSRPWVEKYPQIAAPSERIFVEAAFYKALGEDSFYNDYCPAIIGIDTSNYLFAMEDLGQAADCCFLYLEDSVLSEPDIEYLTDFVSHLHNHAIGDRHTFPDNSALIKLNHTHIFHYPFLENNGFNLDSIQSGLEEIAIRYKRDDALKERLKKLGDVYLQSGNTLIHGDYYPGSWLKTNTGIKIIDPEFSHFGNAEFDLGVMLAHLKMARLNDVAKKVWDRYIIPAEFSTPLLVSFCGVEIMRRIIGLAQLPLSLSLEEKAKLLSQAAQWIQHPEHQEIF
jgi:5-methylthioribose kinase